jgi:hypothetical protein
LRQAESCPDLPKRLNGICPLVTTMPLVRRNRKRMAGDVNRRLTAAQN